MSDSRQSPPASGARVSAAVFGLTMLGSLIQAWNAFPEHHLIRGWLYLGSAIGTGLAALSVLHAAKRTRRLSSK